jgi:gas vesicle protein
MVSKRNKEKLKRAAKRTGELARRAGSAYMSYSDRAADALAKRVKEEADEAMGEAEEVVANPEPNDEEDVAYYRECKRRHREVMQQLAVIEGRLDEIQRPPANEPGTPGEGGHATGMASDFGFGAVGSPDGRADDGDEDWDPDGWLTGGGW